MVRILIYFDRLDPDSHWECGSGCRRAKLATKVGKKLRNLMFVSAWCSLLRAEGFSCKLGVLRDKTIAFYDWKYINFFFSAVNVFQFLIIKTLDLDPDPHPEPHWPKMLDPNPHLNKCGSASLLFSDWSFGQGFGSGSGLDPDSIGPVDPDPDSKSGSGSRRAKMTHKSSKNW